MSNERLTLDLSCQDLTGETVRGGPLPKYLLTGATDRTYKVWNLDDVASGPVKHNRKHMVTDVTWLNHHPGHVTVANDDIYALWHSR